MKNLWLLTAFLAMVSCTPEKKIDYTIISGKIENSKADKISIVNQYNTNKKTDIQLAEDGTFLDTIYPKINTHTYLLRQDNSLTEFYAPKGSTTYIKYDANKKDSTLQITGSTAIINNYIIAKNKIYAEKMPKNNEAFLKNEEEFKKILLDLKKAEEDLLTKTDNISDDFKTSEIKNIEYNYLTGLNSYELYHGYYTKNREFKVSDNFLDELENLPMENEQDFLFSYAYRNLVNSKTREKSNLLAKKDSISGDIAYLTTVSEIQNQTIKNNLLYQSAKYGITYTENLEEFYTLYSNNSTDEENNKEITTSYNKLKALAKGNPSPKFIDYENNAGGTTSLDDLKGKYVYIDVWATWCGPCIAEVPSLKKLEKEYHDKNIEFMSISIDKEKDHEKWQKMIVDKELKGIQLFADNNWESKFVEDYMIKGIPRFILIDPKGNIINANAPRPSDEKLVKTFESLEL
ncbi:TlpA family protein disulfide reductase [Polaribacter sargassicola]|uniref:TlpA family protein disulfide reductase n=1 Tax=Polaribacter sargassicola TaxID=2836891 RepID=UPI001F434A6F|nr:TlpA disulfide reductase family protein [Polaribacter sp. DS7-9]MCG1034778.1 TlpA family protein disulfide reductase [Polaribacter sp. DS7-9]